MTSSPTSRRNYLALVNDDDSFEITDGALRLIDPEGKIIEDGITASRFTEVIGEAVEPYCYTKFVYYKALGYPEGSYRVGPLARLNVVKSMGTPLADKELAEFKQLSKGPVESSFHYHHARLVEAMYGIEKIEQILADPLILDKHVRATAGVNRLEGAGQIEAPRGTLNHHYKVDENGKMTWANLVVATGHNNNAMNNGVLQSAKAYVKDGKFTAGALNRIEAVIRTFDPCLSCSTHAFGQMPLVLSLVNSDGELWTGSSVKVVHQRVSRRKNAEGPQVPFSDLGHLGFQCSPEGARENSPGRKPWVGVTIEAASFP